MRCRPRLGVLVIATTLISGCVIVQPDGSIGLTNASALANLPAETNFCVDEINRYRATVNLPGLTRSIDLESYAAESARVDGLAHQPHQHFSETNGGGIALAENELLTWPNGDIHGVIQRGLGVMWTTGPSGTHYKIMAGAYTQVGCGIFVNDHDVTVAQDFR